MADAPKGTILFEWYSSDPESERYKTRLSNLFKNLGYQVKDYAAIGVAFSREFGVQIGIASLTNPPPEALPIQQAFQRVGIVMPGYILKGHPVTGKTPTNVVIFVGSKP